MKFFFNFCLVVSALFVLYFSVSEFLSSRGVASWQLGAGVLRSLLIMLSLWLPILISLVLLSLRYGKKLLSFSQSRLSDDFHSIGGRMFVTRWRQNNFISLILFFSLLLYIITSLYYPTPVDSFVLMVLLILIIVLWSKQCLFAYRLRHRLFGSSEYETREFLTFLIDEAKESDTHDDGGRPRKLYDPSEFIVQAKNKCPSLIEQEGWSA